MLDIYLKENHFSNRKKKYSFHSKTRGHITQEELVDLVADYGSTVTKADTVAVLSAMENVIEHYLGEGYSVEFPLGTFKISASGSADSENERFKPGRKKYKGERITDHKISINFIANKKKKKDLADKIVTRKVRNFMACEPRIVCVENASITSEEMTVTGALTVRGEYLKIDFTDDRQGIFVYSVENNKSWKVTHFYRNARRTLTFMLPKGLSSGKYILQLYVTPTGTLTTCCSSEFNLVS